MRPSAEATGHSHIFRSNSLVTECFGNPSQIFRCPRLWLTEHPWIKQHYSQLDLFLNEKKKCLELIFVKVFLLPTYWCGFGFVTNGLLCGLQVLISHSESKDGSGGPLDYDDLESGDLVFPRDPVEPTEHQSVIVVRPLNHCGSVSGRASLHCRGDRSTSQDHRSSTSQFKTWGDGRNFISQSPLVLLKTHLAPAISLCFHDVCFMNLTWHFSILKFLHLLPSTDLFSFVSSIPHLPLIVLVYTVSLMFLPCFLLHLNVVKHEVRVLSNGIWSQIPADICFGFVFFSPPSSIARTETTRNPQKHFPGLYQDQGFSRSKTRRLSWSCTTHCRPATPHASPSIPSQKISKSLWRYALHFQQNTSYFCLMQLVFLPLNEDFRMNTALCTLCLGL